jgi:iron complex transport system ATP-binding protein
VLTGTNVERAFDVDAAVTRHPVTGAVDVTATAGGAERDGRVHVLGGGRAGARAIATLADAGFAVSAGVLPNGDTALETADAHGIETVTAAPFAPVDERIRERAATAVRAADVAVLVGSGAANRRLAADAERLVVVDEPTPSNETADRTGVPDRRVEPTRVVGIDNVLGGVEAALAGDTEPPRREAAADD